MPFASAPTTVKEMDYEQAMSSFYEGLYGLADSLARNAEDTCELTPERIALKLAKTASCGLSVTALLPSACIFARQPKPNPKSKLKQ
jgi:hypothetical protein